MISTKTGFGSDTDIIFKNRIGSDSENPLSDHLWWFIPIYKDEWWSLPCYNFAILVILLT